MEHLDVLIVGAGISGIAAAVHLAARCPERRVAILEARAELGGTWDLFRYPGVRSDSDMFSLGFSFRPWTASNAIVDGAAILQYLQDTARERGLYERLRFGHAVQRASWCSRTSRWTVLAAQTGTGRSVELSCSFLYLCTGYYDYSGGYQPELRGVERFRGRIVHPQQWPPGLEHAGKRVVVIGSGATAVSLVPALASSAAHVTLLQRSPSYMLSLPAQEPLMAALRGSQVGAALVRWRNILVGQLFFQLCQRAPALARRLLLAHVRRELGQHCDVDEHFAPRYAPWQQRLCVVRDGDLFRAIREGRVSMVTDTVATLTESGVALASGQQLEADLVVTATGLELKLLGNIALSVDDVPCDVSRSITYRGMMFSGIPNLVTSFGYTNASWTLRSELTATYFCRLLEHMRRRGYQQCRPLLSSQAGPPRPFVELQSGYVRRALHRLPQQGSRGPWRVRQSYLLDWLSLRWAHLADENLQFSAGPPLAAAPTVTREDQLA